MSRVKNLLSNSVVGPLILGVALITAPTVEAAAADEVAEAPAERTIADYHGSYRYVGGETEQERAYAAVDEIVANLNFLIRGMAGRMLRKPTTAVKVTKLDVEGENVTIAGGVGKDLVTLHVGGPGIKYKGDDGKTYTMSMSFRSGKLVQKIVGHNSTTIKTYRLSEDGARLKIKTKISHPMMHKPLEYKFTYRRS